MGRDIIIKSFIWLQEYATRISEVQRQRSSIDILPYQLQRNNIKCKIRDFKFKLPGLCASNQIFYALGCSSVHQEKKSLILSEAVHIINLKLSKCSLCIFCNQQGLDILFNLQLEQIGSDRSTLPHFKIYLFL